MTIASTPTGSKIAPCSTQLCLFEHPRVLNCHNAGSARNIFGEAAATIAIKALNLFTIPINGNFPICLDAFKDGIYFEIKSTRAVGGKVILYDWRMEKEANAGVDIRYIIVAHSIRGTRHDVISVMSKMPMTLVMLGMQDIHTIAKRFPLHRHKTGGYGSKRPGYNRAGYADGYRNLPLSALLESLTFTEKSIRNPYCGCDSNSKNDIRLLSAL